MLHDSIEDLDIKSNDSSSYDNNSDYFGSVSDNTKSMSETGFQSMMYHAAKDKNNKLT